MDDPSEFGCRDDMAHISSLNKTPASIVQEYAAKNKMVPHYDLIFNGVSQNQLVFRYSLSLGDYAVIGEGLSKKEARHVAASRLLRTMIDDNPELLATDFKQWDFDNHVVSPFDNNIKTNAVGKLTDICASNKLGLPDFNLVREEGQAHAKLFTISCQVAKMVAHATHKTKKQAKHLAAVKMVNKLMAIDKSLVSKMVPNASSSDSARIVEHVEMIKSKEKKNAPMDVDLANFHMLFKQNEWPNTSTLDAVVEQYSRDGKLDVSDSEEVLNRIVEECEMNLVVSNVLGQDEVLKNGNEMYILQIESVYPPVNGIGQAADVGTARMLAINNLLENICILYL